MRTQQMILEETGLICEKVSSKMFVTYHSYPCDDFMRTIVIRYGLQHTPAHSLHIFLRPLCLQMGRKNVSRLGLSGITPRKSLGDNLREG